jgi:ribosomal protein L2
MLNSGSEGLAARIVRAAYLGSHMEYWVTADGLAKELFVVSSDVTAPLAPGSVVRLNFVPSGVAVVSGL